MPVEPKQPSEDKPSDQPDSVPPPEGTEKPEDVTKLEGEVSKDEELGGDSGDSGGSLYHREEQDVDVKTKEANEGELPSKSTR